MKILIMHPDLRLLGGIEGYYNKLNGKFSLHVEHFVMGKRPGERGFLAQALRMVKDYLHFFKVIKKEKYDLIHINPSLEYKAFTREGVFLVLARLRGKKTLVFFRGWRKDFEEELNNERRWMFNYMYKKSDAFIVLADDFRDVLRKWGCDQPIFQEVTVADDEIFEKFDFEKALAERMADETWRILFPSRLLEVKGVFEIVDVQGVLRQKYPNMVLQILGDGPEFNNLKKYVAEKKIEGVEFAGFVQGVEKYDYFKKAHVFCFPTKHGEGLPNSLVESMAFGLPSVTRRVGGIADFFKDGEHGFSTISINPQMYADYVEKLYHNRTLYQKIARNNYKYAKQHFVASRAAERLQDIYRKVLNEEETSVYER